jgi:ABC-type lipoprotein release transport system permease subunit
MTAAWLWARSRLRRRWRSLLVIALLAGMGSGVALTAITGSVRAGTGWERFRADTAGANLFFTLPPEADPALMDEVRRIPGVTATGAFVYTPVRPTTVEDSDNIGAFLALDDGFTRTVYRPRILSGRRPDPARADEVTVNRSLADMAGIEPGDRVPVEIGWADEGPITPLAEVTVAGIHVGQFDVGGNAGQPNMLLGNAFRKVHDAKLITGGQPAVVVRLAAGDSGHPAFERHLHEIYGPGVVVASAEQDQAVLVDATNVQRVGLLLLAVAAALATLVAAVQALGRVFGSERSDIATLRSLGMRRRDLAGAGAAVGASAAVAAAILAVTGAVLASRLVPSGAAGELEPPGPRIEPQVLVIGGLVLLVALAIAGALLAVREVRPARASRAQPGPAPGPLPVRLGVHWTFARTAESAAAGSSRAALTAVMVGVAGIAAVITFAASLSHLVNTPRLHGWDFDGGYNTEDLDKDALEEAMSGLADDRRVTGLAWGSILDVPVNGSAVQLFALDQARGFVHPSVIEGRAPVGSDEIALGTETLQRLRGRVGSRVRVGDGRGQSFRVVGRAVYPEIGNSLDLANAGSITIGGLARLDAEPVGALGLLRVRPGTDMDRLFEDYKADGAFPGVPFVAPRVKNIQTVGALPWLMAGFLGILALAAIGHALALSVRARRRDLAVLRALGAVRAQVASAVWSQATLTAVVGAVIGLPIGVALGRQAWGLVADGLGVLVQPVIAWAVLAGVVAAVIAVANLVATWPAMTAARLRPAAALRSE